MFFFHTFHFDYHNDNNILCVYFTGNFKAGPEPGTILKKLCPKEQLCFQVLMKDMLKPYVPEYKGHLTTDDGDCILCEKRHSINNTIPTCIAMKIVYLSFSLNIDEK